MKRAPSFLVGLGIATLSSAALADSKLVLSEVVVSPTPAEFVEIFNPGPTPVNLTNYYLADYELYYLVVTQTPPANPADFLVRFPAGATIQPGEYQTVAIGGAQCFNDACGTVGNFTGFGAYPTYEIFKGAAESSASVTDMVVPFAGAVGASRGLTNSNEPVILFKWDGVSNLVSDVDYVFYGTTGNPPVNKTGIVVNGSTYLPDTSDDPTKHAPLFVGMPVTETCRLDFAETGQLAGGNGITGADETSENWAVTWEACAAPSPGSGPASGTSGTGGAGGAGSGGTAGAGGVAGAGGAGGAGGVITTGGAGGIGTGGGSGGLSPTGGAGGVGGTPGGAGGIGGAGGTVDAASSTASSASSSTSAATTGAGAAGVGSGGGSGASDSGGSGSSATPGDDGGCGCRVAGHDDGSAYAPLGFAALALAGLRRRRSRRI